MDLRFPCVLMALSFTLNAEAYNSASLALRARSAAIIRSSAARMLSRPCVSLLSFASLPSNSIMKVSNCSSTVSCLTITPSSADSANSLSRSSSCIGDARGGSSFTASAFSLLTVTSLRVADISLTNSSLPMYPRTTRPASHCTYMSSSSTPFGFSAERSLALSFSPTLASMAGSDRKSMRASEACIASCTALLLSSTRFSSLATSNLYLDIRAM
mmetsp:Transcript_83942/g.167549  ORF Transcript_83942/g.167549 Transcript_83942/m.167549 type:complete len:215 (+) Transcript_83942:384-1028(+)